MWAQRGNLNGRRAITSLGRVCCTMKCSVEERAMRPSINSRAPGFLRWVSLGRRVIVARRRGWGEEKTVGVEMMTPNRYHVHYVFVPAAALHTRPPLQISTTSCNVCWSSISLIRAALAVNKLLLQWVVCIFCTFFLFHFYLSILSRYLCLLIRLF